MNRSCTVMAALFTLVFAFNSDPLMAQIAQAGATTDQELANEIAALRKRVEQLERQNAELHASVRATKKKSTVEPANMNGAVARVDANVYAADLPYKTAPFVPTPVRVSNWSGVYMGIEGGYGWGRQSTDAIDPGAQFSPVFTSNQHPGQLVPLTSPIFFPDLALASTKQNGWLFGGFFGVQKQWGSLVLGIEGDIDGANIRGAGSSSASLNIAQPTFGPFFSIPSLTFTCPGGPCFTLNRDLSIDSKIDMLASLRGKVGWSFAPDWLIYGTGGAAFSHVKTTVASTQSAAINPFLTSLVVIDAGAWHLVAPGATPALIASGGTTMFGWAAGAGIDWKFWHDDNAAWVFGVEYLHYGFPEQTITLSNNAGGSLAFNVREHVDSVKARMSYQFSIH